MYSRNRNKTLSQRHKYTKGNNNNIQGFEMKDRITDISQRQAAIVAGVGLLIMFFVAIFAYGFVLESLIVPGDATATANNIIASEILFRSGVFAFLVILILDVLVAWALYVYLKRVNKSLSLFTAWLRLVYAGILGIALLNLVIVLLLLSGADYLVVIGTDQLHAQVLLFLNAFNDIWAIGLVVFGLHLLVLGYLIFKSGFIPKILGILVIIASLGYLIVNLGNLLLPNHQNSIAIIESVFMAPMVIGEMGLAIWLLIKGGKH